MFKNLYQIQMRNFKFLILIYFLFFTLQDSCKAIAYEDVKIDVYGDTNISSRGNSHSFETNFHIEYNFSLYEPDHKKWGLFIAGKVNPAYDHLGNEIKMDVFTVMGIDF